ncbi:hypothetical protein [Alicyclobacillus herbarius]|uniref:hypothetical protein n=1 Tax=Alicyclobacillus herbarius TaxID=122960 RepID=UPI0004152349|nr:hypothetical protein [Alicyclobacillus herbarius]
MDKPQWEQRLEHMEAMTEELIHIVANTNTQVAQLTKKVDDLTNDVAELKEQVGEMNERLGKVEFRMEAIERHVSRIPLLERRQDKAAARLDAIEACLELRAENH